MPRTATRNAATTPRVPHERTGIPRSGGRWTRPGRGLRPSCGVRRPGTPRWSMVCGQEPPESPTVREWSAPSLLPRVLSNFPSSPTTLRPAVAFDAIVALGVCDSWRHAALRLRGAQQPPTGSPGWPSITASPSAFGTADVRYRGASTRPCRPRGVPRGQGSRSHGQCATSRPHDPRHPGGMTARTPVINAGFTVHG